MTSEYLPRDRETGLIRYGAWCSMEVTPCPTCWFPLVILETWEGGLDITSKVMEAKTWPCYGLWFMGEEHTEPRCQQLRTENAT